MLSEARAQELVWRAAHVRDDSGGDARARRAMHRLISAADRGDQAAIEALWRVWLMDPHDAGWELLKRWRDPAELAAAVLALVTRPDQTPSRALGAFCVQHGLIPDDDLEQILFYVKTRQHALRRAADPGGELTAAVYQRADRWTRDALRGALRGAQEPLWRVVRDLPVEEAADAMECFGDGWRPADARDRLLFDLFGSIKPYMLRYQRGALARSGYAEVSTHRRAFRAGALSPDGRWLAMVKGKRITLIDVQGEVMPRQLHVARSHAALLCFADDALIVCNAGRPGDPDGRVMRYDAGLTPVAGLRLTPSGSEITGLAPTFPDGFAVLCGHRVTFCGADGEPAGTLELPDEPRPPALAKRRWSLLTTEPGGRLAVAGKGGFAVYDASDPRRARPLAQVPCAGRTAVIRFCGPERLITITRARGMRTVRLWRLGEEQPQLQAVRRIIGSCDPVPVPPYGTIAIRSFVAHDVRFLDADLRDTAGPDGFLGAARWWGSPDGNYWAYHTWGHARVRTGLDPAPALEVADLPQAEWGPADLATVSEVLEHPLLPALAREFLHFLQACLEWRLGPFRDTHLSAGVPVPL